MQGALIAATVEGAADGLAVDRDGLSIWALSKGLGPGGEATFEVLRVDQHKNTPERVMGRNAVGQGYQLSELSMGS
jgi:hypothetical protein